MAAAAAVKRKKWTEEEERSLIDKYGEMLLDGTLSRMKTREKKFRPIAAHVNAAHHALDPVSFPFQWSWNDTSTKVQNMRHQYLLVKQKLISSSSSASSVTTKSPSSAEPANNGGGGGGGEQLDFPWDDGLSHWPNFLRYKHVFGDVPLPSPGSTAPAPAGTPLACNFDAEIALDEDDGDLGLEMGFDCDAEDGDEEGFDFDDAGAPPLPQPLAAQPLAVAGLPQAATAASRKKRRKRTERRAWAFLESQLARLKEREAQLEEREADWDRERQRRERVRAELEEERERGRREKEEQWEERWRRRREEERRWEERAEGRRLEWRKRMEGMLSQHRAEMEQLQARALHDQQSIINQMLGIGAQWVGPSPHSGGMSDGGGIGHHHHYFSQMMQNLQHVNEMVHGENRVGGDSQDDQFIVDVG